MRNTLVISVLVFSGCLCSRASDDAKNAASAAILSGVINHELAKKGEHVDFGKAEASLQGMAAQQQEWKKRDVINYHKLETVLPDAPSGWTAADPEGRSVTAGAFAISETERKYTKGTSNLTVKFADWAENPAALGLSMAFSVDEETANGYRKPFNIPGGWGTENWEKNNKRAEITGITKNRIWVSIEGNQLDNTQVAKDLFAKIDLGKLDLLAP